MNQKAKNITKISVITLLSMGALYAAYKFLFKKMGETGSTNETTTTLSNGATVTTTGDKNKPATSSDKSSLKKAVQRWVDGGKFTTKAQTTINSNAGKLTRGEIQDLTYLLNMADLKKNSPYGLSTKDATDMLNLIKKIS